jgi:hypothetical protein
MPYNHILGNVFFNFQTQSHTMSPVFHLTAIKSKLNLTVTIRITVRSPWPAFFWVFPVYSFPKLTSNAFHLRVFYHQRVILTKTKFVEMPGQLFLDRWTISSPSSNL